MKKPSLLPRIGMLLGLLLGTFGVFLYAKGYRLDLTQRVVGKTGIILVRTIPEGAKVYLGGKLVTISNSSITNLKPGPHYLKIEKEGYFSWERTVTVEEGFVTGITALLPPLSPSLTAVTQKGASLVTPAPSGSKTLFISGKDLYFLSLTSPALGFLRTSPQKIAEETADFPLSKATKIAWSPNEDQALITLQQTQGEQSYLVTTTGRNGQPTLVVNPESLLEDWGIAKAGQRADLIKGSGVGEELAAEAIKPETVWSPDERRFFYVKTANGKRQFWVVDLSDPLPIGREEHRMILETDNAAIKLFWLADSEHFVMLNGGTVSLLDLDGSNKRDLFRGTLAEAVALSTTDLSKIIILTSLAPETPPNLYAISLR